MIKQYLFGHFFSKNIFMDEIDDKLHIIISGERGKIIRVPCSKKKLKIAGIFISFFLLCISTALVGALFFSFNGDDFLAQFRQESTRAITSPDVASSRSKEQADRLRAKVSLLQKQNREQLEQFEQEREVLLGDTLGELSSRSKMLEELFNSIGIIIPEKTKIRLQDSENSGGPFREISPLAREKDELINRIDVYIKKAESIPLGRPVQGKVTSDYGKRRDPLNGRASFHEGIDFRGRVGEKIYATANGVVIKAGWCGGYGKYVEVRHGDGYKTAYGHLHEILVKNGQKIKRGDVIGHVGNTGRSTGPHLHYEVKYRNKPIDPGKFIKIASNVKFPPSL